MNVRLGCGHFGQRWQYFLVKVVAGTLPDYRKDVYFHAMRIITKYRWLFVCVLLSRLMIVAFVYPETHRLYNGDSALYEQYALSMLETGKYLSAGYGTYPADPFADMIRPPGLPVLLYVVYGVVGSDAGPWVTALLGALMSLLVLYLLILFLEALGLHRARWVLWLFVVDPTWILYSKEILTEPYFVPLWLSALYFGLGGSRGIRSLRNRDSLGHISQKKAMGYLSVSGLCFGMATLFKPIGFYAPWVALPLLIWLCRADSGIRWKPVMVFFLVSQLFIFGWQMRNYAKHGTFAYTSIAAENLMTGHAAFVLAGALDLTHEEAQQEIRRRFDIAHPDRSDYSFKELSDAKTSVARDILWTHKMIYVQSIARGMVVTMLDPGRLVTERTFGDHDPARIGLTNVLAREGVWGTFLHLLRNPNASTYFLLLHIVYLSVLFLLFLSGSVLFVRRYPVLAVCIGLSLLYLWVLGGPSGYARFRMYLLPQMLIMMAILGQKK